MSKTVYKQHRLKGIVWRPRIRLLSYSKSHSGVWASKFLRSPSFQNVVYLMEADVSAWVKFLKLPQVGPDDLEILKNRVDQVGTDKEPHGLARPFVKNSSLYTVYHKMSQYPRIKRRRMYTLKINQEFFENMRKLPLFLKNIAVAIVFHFKLSTEAFLASIPDGFNLKNSSTDTYLKGCKSIARAMDMSLEEFRKKAFSKNSTLSRVEIAESIHYQCHKGEWLSATASNYLSGLKYLGRTCQNDRFQDKYWSNLQGDLLKSYPQVGKDKLMKKDLLPMHAKRLYYELLSLGHIRYANFIRFLALTGQRSVDYRKLQKSDIKIDYEQKTVRINWYWGKTRKRNMKVQYTLLPFGESGEFFDILTCVNTLLKTCPARRKFLLRFKVDGKQISHGKLLRKLFSENLPKNLHPNCLNGLQAYTFKNLLAIVVRRAELPPEVIIHYLKHSLTREEWREMCHSGVVKLGHLSQQYALQVNFLPEIKRKLGKFWKLAPMS